MNTIYKNLVRFKCLIFLMLVSSCDDFVEIDPPRTDLVRSTVFANDATAKAAMVDIYYQMTTSGFASGSALSYTVYGSLSSDETTEFATNSKLEYQQFNNNALLSNNILIENLWRSLYTIIYKANAVLEGVSSSEISANTKKTLEGESKFIRAFCLFYLVNLWGDVPLVISTDYEKNNVIPRSSQSLVYEQIINDLKDAQTLLPNDYAISNNARVRANKMAATAFLSRVYLYIGDWSKAEQEATAVINNTQFSLEPDLTKIFRTTSQEAIFQLWSNVRPNDRLNFMVFDNFGPFLTALRPEFVQGFEPNDKRWSTYGRKAVNNGITYLGVEKYSGSSAPVVDYSTVLRLAEQYLIRAEARAQLNKPAEAVSDLNVIRKRAGLNNSTSTTQMELLNEIMQERRSEFFTEWGHRWLDLKRTGRAHDVLAPIKPEWNNEDVWYPIPDIQIINNPNTMQNNNPG